MADKISGGYRLPHWLLVAYALLFMLLGWFGAGVWAGYHPAPVCAALLPPPAKVAPSAPAVDICEGNILPPLHYSAHVYAADPTQRSITLNSRQYREGDPLPCDVVVAQIQQDVTVLEQHGRVVVLDALEDWPGGSPDEGENHD